MQESDGNPKPPTTRRARIDVERLRELSRDRRAAGEGGAVAGQNAERAPGPAPHELPDILQQRQEETARQREERMRRLREKFESRAEPEIISDNNTIDSDRGDLENVERPRKAVRPVVKRRKEYLEPKQHARLRDQIEHLWAVDKRFRNWSLLAKAAGLSSGQAVKRAYEVNSSMATLRNIDTFARLHAGFGSRATRALQNGVAVDDLQAHLMGAAAGEPAGASEAGGSEAGTAARRRPAAGARRGRPPARAAEPAPTMDDLGETPPTVDFASLVELGQAVDTEVKRLWLVAKFFDGVSRKTELPRTVRESATQAREHLRKAVELFAGSEPAPRPRAEDAAEAAAQEAAGEAAGTQSPESASQAGSTSPIHLA